MVWRIIMNTFNYVLSAILCISILFYGYFVVKHWLQESKPKKRPHRTKEEIWEEYLTYGENEQ